MRHGHANVQTLLQNLFLLSSRLEGFSFFDAEVLEPGVEEAIAIRHRFTLNIGVHQFPEPHVARLGIQARPCRPIWVHI